MERSACFLSHHFSLTLRVCKAWRPLCCITCPPPSSPFYPNISSFRSELSLSLWEHSRGKGVQKGLISESLSLGTIGPQLLCSLNNCSFEWPWVWGCVATDSVTWPLVASVDRDEERRSLRVGKCNICDKKKDLLIFLRNLQVSEMFS